MVNVSIIIPTRNRARWLKKSIRSVLDQTYQDFELIVVDDGSTDKTPEVIKSFKDKRIRYFRQLKSRGAAVARNIGIRKAKGKFIAFNDDDDFWQPMKLEKQIKAFRGASGRVGVIYTGLNRIINEQKKYFPEKWVKKKEGSLQQELFFENFIDLSATMVRRKCFDEVGLFDEALPRYQDWELWLRISRNYQFQFIDQPLVDSYVLPRGITQKRRVLLQATERIFNKYKQEIKKNKKVLAAWQFRLGDLYYYQEKMKKARKLFTQAFKNRPSFRYFRAIIKTILGKKISQFLINWKINLIRDWRLVGILGLAFILRLINLNQSLWLDEAVQALTSQSSFLGVFQELRGDFNPPLYHLLMWGWVHLFGSSEIILRLPSVLFGVATVYIVYKIGKVISDQRSAISDQKITGYWIPITGALFLATAPFHIYYSQEARNYALATFLAALSMYYFIRVISEQWLVVRKKLAISYLLSTTLLLYTNYFGLFILLAQALVFLWRGKRHHLRLMLYCLLLFTPNLFLLRVQFLTGSQATTSLPEWGRLVNVNFLKALPLTFVKFSIGRITIFNKKLYALIAGILFIIYGGVITRGLLNKKLTINNLQLTIILWLVVPIGCAWLVSFFIPNYQPFRLLLVLPAFYLLLALGVSRINITMYRCIVIIFILLVNLTAASVYYTNPYFHREDWRGLVQFTESQPKEEKVVILPSQTSYWPYQYYSTGKISLVGLSEGFQTIKEKDLDKRLSHYPGATIYYIRYLVPMFDSQEKTTAWLNQNGFVKIKEVGFNQIPLWIYEPL